VREYLAGWESVAGPALSHADGLLRLAAGSLAASRESLERAVRGWEERGRVWESIWARVDLASCLLRMNRYAEAASHLAAARDTATSLESTPLISRIDELAEIAHRHGSFDEPWRPLTTREFEVARLIAGGLTNGEIAGELSIASKTASAHVEHILAKLGVARRAEIATWVATVAHPVGSVPESRAGAIAHR
jgi:DNA-binding CsgD family transcriptional regulator